MKQTALQARPSSAAGKKNRMAAHSAVRVLPARESQTEGHYNPTGSAFDHDFSAIPTLATNSQANRHSACAFSPGRCPFGGSCHSCPLPVQLKAKKSKTDIAPGNTQQGRPRWGRPIPGDVIRPKPT